MHFLPFPQSLGPRGKLDRYKPSHKEQFEEGKYSPRRLGELTHTSSLLLLQKKKAIWGSLSHQKWFPSDLRKRLKISSLGRGYWETQSSSTLEPPIDFISTAMAKLGPFSWQPALSRTGDGEIQGEEIRRAPQAQGSPPRFPQSSGGMRRAEYTITRLSSCRRPAEGNGGESRAG